MFVGRTLFKLFESCLANTNYIHATLTYLLEFELFVRKVGSGGYPCVFIVNGVHFGCVNTQCESDIFQIFFGNNAVFIS